jgi:hypothetical protein
MFIKSGYQPVAGSWGYANFRCCTNKSKVKLHKIFFLSYCEWFKLSIINFIEWVFSTHYITLTVHRNKTVSHSESLSSEFEEIEVEITLRLSEILAGTRV